jgi:glycolate oxidase
MDDRIKQEFIKIVGEENYTERLIDMVSYSYDASEHFHRPSCGVWPETAEQIAEIMKLANREAIPVIPRGSGTGLSGMAIPAKGGIVLDLSHMNKILKISIEDRLVIVQPGVVYETLEKALAPYGFFFPPDPASGKVCTLGGKRGHQRRRGQGGQIRNNQGLCAWLCRWFCRTAASCAQALRRSKAFQAMT